MEHNTSDSRDYPAAYEERSPPPARWYGKEAKAMRKEEIKKNMGNYQAYQPEHPHVFSQNIFNDLEGVGSDKKSNELLHNLKDRYERIYRENYLLDRQENKRYKSIEASKSIKSPKAEQTTLPFVSQESVRDSQLIQSLISPLKSVEKSYETEEYNQFKSVELHSNRVALKAFTSSDDINYATQQQQTQEKPRKSANLKDKFIHPIFENFEKEAYIESLAPENRSGEDQPSENNKSVSQHSASKGNNSSIQKKKKEKKLKYQRLLCLKL
jgi:hypothetical protein